MTYVPPTPGLYLTGRRLAAGFSHDDVAIRIDSVPAVAAARRAEWLRAIEADLVPVRMSTAVALAAVPELAIDLPLLAELVDGFRPAGGDAMLVRFIPAPLAGEVQ